MKALAELLQQMKSDTVTNYVIAGLDSSLITKGCVRLFENSREHLDSITPHSHRFDFVCLVLQGWVENTIWEEVKGQFGDEFQLSKIIYNGVIGQHTKIPNNVGRFRSTTTRHDKGEYYSMESHEIHSIKFSKGAKVLFFEGPAKSNESVIIEPYVRGQVIPTFENKAYMFGELDVDQF